jgi:ABC-type uncharacterized transport system substrate-binding protein
VAGADRVRAGHRPGRRRFRREPGTAGRRRDWVHHLRIQHERNGWSCIVTLAGRHKLPAVYNERSLIAAGGLISGPDPFENFRRSASYVDRVFKGARPADLPVQQPMKFELIINLKSAKALGLELPPSLLARADEVIE